MTSEQVMLTLTTLLVGGCALLESQRGAEPLPSPYPQRTVWAVAPVRNESGSLQVDQLVFADHLARQLENASNIDVLPVNRTLKAMDMLQMAEVSGPAQVIKLLKTLDADAIVLGTVTAYDPYDPPKIGLSIELYLNRPPLVLDPGQVHRLTRAATGDRAPKSGRRAAPVSTVSGYFDAADPHVATMLQKYAKRRGVGAEDHEAWRLYRINIDLYTEFVSYVTCWRLLHAETVRLMRSPPVTTTPAP